MSINAHIEHIFRNEYGVLVSILVRQFGLQQLSSAEDAVQWSLAQALEKWPRTGKPDKPAAWLFKVAQRFLLTELRQKTARRIEVNQYDELQSDYNSDQHAQALSGELKDALLRMLFVACDDSIPIESQLVFTLKCLCGFSIKEVSLRLFISEANVYKRFSRAKRALADLPIDIMELPDDDIGSRLGSVLRVLYLLFTEGYLSSSEDAAIRQELCKDALRLTVLISQSRYGSTPVVSALIALMYFNIARIDSRINELGLVLLEQQARESWDQQMIAQALIYLERSAKGNTLSRYHVEAGIAAEHCLAQSFEQTRWDKIATSYQLLESITGSPLLLLNRAIATAEWKTPQHGLVILESANLPTWLQKSYLWHAVSADLQFRSNQNLRAIKNADMAIQAAPSQAIKQALQSRFNNLKNNQR